MSAPTDSGMYWNGGKCYVWVLAEEYEYLKGRDDELMRAELRWDAGVH